MAERSQNLQDLFLNTVRKKKISLTIFLINGVKLTGVITSFDNFCVLLRRDGHSQLVYKHAISTIMPGQPLELKIEEGPDRSQNLQDLFLSTVRKKNIALTIFLINGVKLTGVVTAFDNFCELLRRDDHAQLVYKHAISTIMPGQPMQMFENEEGAAREAS
ncbi:RNA-binding protein Hfq [Agrobacterium pusense]|uniref:RNA-binding protein Hfq n=2 Tax=Agrobacterium pusense TaxID=648995 RepID=U4Q3N6_9HYPH|nr:RNA-binding protein Hfq [Agrobacterium pusense]